ISHWSYHSRPVARRIQLLELSATTWQGRSVDRSSSRTMPVPVVRRLPSAWHKPHPTATLSLSGTSEHPPALDHGYQDGARCLPRRRPQSASLAPSHLAI